MGEVSEQMISWEEKQRRKQLLAAEIETLRDAASIVAHRAGLIELHAAKNTAAEWDRGAEKKLSRAAALRRVAAFLADTRLHALIGEDVAGVGTIFRTDPPSRALTQTSALRR